MQYYLIMVSRLLTAAVMLLVGACEKTPPEPLAPVSNPTQDEATLFGKVLPHPNHIRIDRTCIDPITSEAGRASDIYFLSFGDGKLVYRDEPRVDELARRYSLASPLRPHRLRIPNVPSGSGKPCDWRLRYYPPLFEGDLAYVASSQWHARGEFAGGQYRISIFRKVDRRWDFVASSWGTYGRPII